LFTHKTTPYAHQQITFERSRDMEIFAILFEQGCGKTKVFLDTAAWLYLNGNITGVVVIAPPGVPANWARNEIPKHLSIFANVVLWSASGSRTKKFAKEVHEALHGRELSVLLINYEAVATERGYTFVRNWLLAGPALLGLDESQKIKTPSARRTKFILRLAKTAQYRRILTGTPATENPLAFYTQFRFLDVRVLGLTSFYSFKHHYAKWEKKRDWQRGHDYEELVEYRNLDELAERIRPYSVRVEKADCLDLPPKLYETVYVELSKEMRSTYDKLAEELVIEIGGEVINAAHVLARLTRLLQITSGFLSTEDKTIELGGDPKTEACPPRIVRPL